MASGLLKKGKDKDLWLSEDTVGYELQIRDKNNNIIESGKEMEFEGEVIVAKDEAELCNGQFTEVFFFEIEK